MTNDPHMGIMDENRLVQFDGHLSNQWDGWRLPFGDVSVRVMKFCENFFINEKHRR